MWYNTSAPLYALLTKAVSCKCDLLCVLVPLVMSGIDWGGKGYPVAVVLINEVM